MRVILTCGATVATFTACFRAKVRVMSSLLHIPLSSFSVAITESVILLGILHGSSVWRALTSALGGWKCSPVQGGSV